MDSSLVLIEPLFVVTQTRISSSRQNGSISNCTISFKLVTKSLLLLAISGAENCHNEPSVEACGLIDPESSKRPRRLGQHWRNAIGIYGYQWGAGLLSLVSRRKRGSFRRIGKPTKDSSSACAYES